MRDKIWELAKTRNITLPPEAPDRFEMYYRQLVEANRQVNLTRITEPAEVMIKHFLDSLEVLSACREFKGPLLDVGTGAGLPGIPLKIACPQISLTLLDSSKKRVSFLKDLVSALELENVTVIHGRAEDYARQDDYREQFPFVVSRAVARLNVLAELCLPFVSQNGYFVAYKGPEGATELQEAQNALSQLGGAPGKEWRYQLPENMGERSLLFLRKLETTPAKYPRKAGLPEKRPL
ncbi:16S rRNA (guanine(527)-N(7))-methyltransferase RsmG [Dethiobacter alkaliphilus]|uniref:Ribosomal RNA small subunit methyltransferase G n=1 Tax=Dethiobacter alkaliphilus AHT 1 TaxID=555088 RepID=C0GI79_DETAL|nr:16S rRNA (guanine(527)-N(7))-methyltransferase RsmG [Dethiobacter alkaliphilus]EEG76927.1 methyltransferase GidB [Dethiobacter alkaliphilus AHT 1]